MKLIPLISSACMLTGTAIGAPSDMTQHNITIYSKATPGAMNPSTFEAQANNPNFRMNIPGYAMIRSVAEMSLIKGTGNLKFTDVAAGIDPTTVSFKSLSHPDTTTVLEQNYQYDLVGTGRMLERYLGQRITVQQIMGETFNMVEGKLMASSGSDVIIQLDNGQMVSISAGARNIVFPELPDGLITQPTLDWLVRSERGGKHDVQVSYETRGMTWWSDYNIIYQPERDTLDLNSWVTIVNQSGGTFEDAKLKLIAGDVNRAQSQQPIRVTGASIKNMAQEKADGFSEKELFEYHLYTLGRPATLPDRSIKQLELFPSVQNVPVRKTLIFDAGHAGWGYGSGPNTGSNNPFPVKSDVQVFLEFVNSRDHGLGVPMPAGRIRVSQQDPDDGNLEFIGEDTLDHTPRNEEISLKLGNAFDVIGERKQLDFSIDTKQRWMEETIEVTLRNQKSESVEVLIRESVYRWSNWQVIRQSDPFEKTDAATLEFNVEVDPEAEKKVMYTARYTW